MLLPRLALLFAFPFAVACAAPGGAKSTSTTGSGGTWGASSTTSSVGATTGVTSTSGATTASSTSTGAGTPMPSPPAGTTMCGMGTTTAADVQAACAKTPTMGMFNVSPHCDAVTTTGASWQAWCDATELRYVWVTFHQADAVSTGITHVCNVTQSGGDAIEGMYGNPDPSMANPSWFVTQNPADFSTGYNVNEYGTSGSRNVWLIGVLECSDLTMPNSTTNIPGILLGFTVKWQPAMGG